MQRHVPAAALAAVLSAAIAPPAQSHIEYYDLNQGRQIADLTAAGKAVAGNDIPLTTPAYWSATYQTPISSGETWTSLGGSFASGTWGWSVRVTNFDSAAWTDGLRRDPNGGAYLLGDTHKLNFANFHLATAAYVTITVADDYAGTGYGLNPSFSLYRGAAVYQAHDEATADPLNPRSPFPPFNKLQSTKDNGTTVDTTQGITSPYRNTLTNGGTYAGQFDALGGFSVANPAGDWSAVQYVTAVTGYVNPDGSFIGNANASTLASVLLPAGDYIVAFGGNATLPDYAAPRSGGDFVASNLPATLTFSAVAVAPVPEPATWASMLAGLCAVGAALRRRARRCE